MPENVLVEPSKGSFQRAATLNSIEKRDFGGGARLLRGASVETRLLLRRAHLPLAGESHRGPGEAQQPEGAGALGGELNLKRP